MVRSHSPRLVVAPWRELASRLASDLVPALSDLRRLDGRVEPPVVIVPGGGVARGVQSALARQFGGSFVSPRFLTPERLAETILSSREEWRPPAGATLRSLAMHAAAREAGSNLVSTESLAAIANRSWRDAVDGGVDPRKLASRSDASHREFLREAEQVWRRYAATLAAAGVVDPAEHLQNATTAVRSDGIGLPVFAIYGFYDATGLQTRFLRAVIETSNIGFVYVPASMDGDQFSADYAFAERLVHDLGLSPAIAETIPGSPPSIDLCPLSTSAQQRGVICDLIAAELESGRAAERIGVVARSFSPPDVEMWRLAADARGFSFETRTRRLAGGTRTGRAIALLLAVRDRSFQRSDVLDLIEIGVRPLREARRESMVITAHTRERSLASGDSATLQARFGADASEPIRLYIAAVTAIEELVPVQNEPRSGPDWARTVDGWLNAIQMHDADDLRTHERIKEWIDDLHSLHAIRLTGEEILKSLAQLEIDAGTSAGVFLGDVMQSRGRTFDSLYLVDAIEGSLPQGRIQDPLLRDELRERTGLRTIGSGESEERLLFRAALDSSVRVTIAWPDSDASGRTTRPSPLVTALAAALHPADTAAILSDLTSWTRRRSAGAAEARSRDVIAARSLLRGDGSAVSAAARSVLSAHDEIGSRSRWDGFLPASEELRVRLVERLGAISPTALQTFGACPHNFLVSALLRIDDAKDPEDLLELEVQDKGNVLHRVLERFYRELGAAGVARWDASRRELTPELERLLIAHVEDAFNELDTRHPPRFPRMRELERHDAVRTLRAFLVEDLRELATSGFTPRHFEFRFGEIRGHPGDAPATIFEFGGVAVEVRGSIDRVDEHPDGRVRIVDYKRSGTSYSDLAEKVRRGQLLQLAMYCRAWNTITGTSADLISARILPIRKPGIIPAEKLSFEYSEIATGVERTIGLFASGILAGWFPAVPGTHCKYCPVRMGCRVSNDPEAVAALDGQTAAEILWPDEVWD